MGNAYETLLSSTLYMLVLTFCSRFSICYEQLKMASVNALGFFSLATHFLCTSRSLSAQCSYKPSACVCSDCSVVFSLLFQPIRKTVSKLPFSTASEKTMIWAVWFSSGFVIPLPTDGHVDCTEVGKHNLYQLWPLRV